MNIHKNARTTPQSRAVLVARVLQERWPVNRVAQSFGISQRTVYKWLARYRAEGAPGLQDRRCTARRRPHALSPTWVELIRLMRRGKRVASEIAQQLPIPRSTVSAVLARLGLGRMWETASARPVRRYEWPCPGDLVHLDTKKLGRIARPSHRVTGDPRDSVDGAGWEFAHVAIDDYSRFTYVEILPDEKRYTATGFLLRALREFRRRGIAVKRILTDNGGAYRSRPFRKACRWLGISAKRTRPYRPQTNGKAERMIQTLLRKWAYAVPYANSQVRQAALTPWLRFYNEQRPHAAINHRPPISRLVSAAEQRS
jgi:transposase InsO family protein